MQICASLNHRKKMKAEPIRLIPRKLTANLELFAVKWEKLCFAINYISSVEGILWQQQFF